MNHEKIFLILALAIMVISGYGYNVRAQSGTNSTLSAQQNRDRGFLCKTDFIEIAHPELDRGDGTCESPAFKNDGGICVEENAVDNAFVYMAREDGSLDFGLTYWFDNGAHCGIIGNAKQTEWGWRYESNMGSTNEVERCLLDITIKSDMVLFDTHPDASCRMECGAQAYLHGIFLPLSGLVTRDVDERYFDPENLYNTLCP